MTEHVLDKYRNSILIDPIFLQGEDSSRLTALTLLLAGYNNTFIATQLNFSLKNIESIISKILIRANIKTRTDISSYFNPRISLLLHGLQNNWLEYNITQPASNSYSRAQISKQNFLTLMMASVGCSNKALSELLCISRKTVESRLNSLFNQFGATNKLDQTINPRTRLIVHAILDNIIDQNIMVELTSLVKFHDWDSVLENRNTIYNIVESYQAQNAIPYLDNQTDISSILNKIQQHSKINQ